MRHKIQVIKALIASNANLVCCLVCVQRRSKSVQYGHVCWEPFIWDNVPLSASCLEQEAAGTVLYVCVCVLETVHWESWGVLSLLCWFRPDNCYVNFWTSSSLTVYSIICESIGHIKGACPCEKASRIYTLCPCVNSLQSSVKD